MSKLEVFFQVRFLRGDTVALPMLKGGILPFE
jgi:hypothetical protein